MHGLMMGYVCAHHTTLLPPAHACDWKGKVLTQLALYTSDDRMGQDNMWTSKGG